MARYKQIILKSFIKNIKCRSIVQVQVQNKMKSDECLDDIHDILINLFLIKPMKNFVPK